jgi:putative tryptophan/tyrosine transport system substrate-binding protein
LKKNACKVFLLFALLTLSACFDLPSKKEWRIGLIVTTTPEDGESLSREIRRELLPRLKNPSLQVVIQVSAMQEGVSIKKTVSEALSRNPDVLLVVAASLAEEARNQNTTIPIIYRTLFDPVATGLSLSAIRFSDHASIHFKRWEIAASALPSARKIGVLINPQYSADVSNALPTKLNSGVEMIKIEWTYEQGLDKLAHSIEEQHIDAIDIGVGIIRPEHIEIFSKWCLTNRLPTIFDTKSHIQKGGLISFNAIPLDRPKYFAEFLYQLSLGAKADDLPIRYPNQYLISLNTNTAKQLSLRPPSSFLRRVDYWYE